VCSNMEAQKRLTESNGTPAMDLGHMNDVLKWCICMLIVAAQEWRNRTLVGHESWMCSKIHFTKRKLVQ
jgi:predicted short-subunit dehydrogenase-like oxidoreductase (DUF2520 family)